MAKLTTSDIISIVLFGLLLIVSLITKNMWTFGLGAFYGFWYIASGETYNLGNERT